MRNRTDFDFLSTIESIVVAAEDYKKLQKLIEKNILTEFDIDLLAKSYYSKKRIDPNGCYTKIQQALKFKSI